MPIEIFKPTSEQEKILSALKDMQQGSAVVVNAYAGCGKTSTAKFIVKTLAGKRFSYLCFNKSAADEARSDLMRHSNCKVATTHGMAYKALGIIEWDNKKLTSYISPQKAQEMLGSSFGMINFSQSSAITKTISKFCQSLDEEITLDHYDGNDYINKSQIVKASQKIFDLMIDEDEKTPLLHDVYVKLYQLILFDETDRFDEIFCDYSFLSETDYIVLDEAQDTNPVILGILKKVVNEGGGKLLAIGSDTHQQIYSWRGAVNAMEDLKESCNSKELFLSKSWRCPQSLCNLGWEVLTDKIYSAPLSNAPSITGIKDGISQKCVIATDLARLLDSSITPSQQTMVLARNNATLVSALINLKNVNPSKICILGGKAARDELIQACNDLYSLWIGETDKIKDDFVKGFEQWSEIEAFHQEESSSLGWLVKMPKYLTAIPEFIRKFSDDNKEATYVFSTAHRAKGAEAHQVVLLGDILTPPEIEKLSGQETPENFRLTAEKAAEANNLLYVAVTRAKTRLYVPLSSPLHEYIEERAPNILWESSRKSPQGKQSKAGKAEAKNNQLAFA